MKKLFFPVIILILVIALSINAAASTGSSGSSEGGSLSPEESESYSVDFKTYDGEPASAYIRVIETQDINYGIEFNLEIDSPDKFKIVANLYDEDENLLTNELSEVNVTYLMRTEVFDYNLYTEAQTYTVKFQVATLDGEYVCDMQTVSVFHEGADIRYGYIVSAKQGLAIGAVYEAEICESTGSTETYNFHTRTTLNNSEAANISAVIWIYFRLSSQNLSLLQAKS